MSVETMKTIKIESTEEIVKRCKAEGKSKEEAWNEAYGGVNMPWFVQDTLKSQFENFWNA